MSSVAPITPSSEGGQRESADTSAGRSPLLTRREREIVQLIAEGRTTREVAATLRVSQKTVEAHRSNILRKLDLHSAVDLVRYAIRNHLISGDE